jgi:hypothetical protein
MDIDELSQLCTLQRQLHDAVNTGLAMAKEVIDSAASDTDKYNQLIYDNATTLGEMAFLVDAMGQMLDNAKTPSKKSNKQRKLCRRKK